MDAERYLLLVAEDGAPEGPFGHEAQTKNLIDPERRDCHGAQIYYYGTCRRQRLHLGRLVRRFSQSLGSSRASSLRTRAFSTAPFSLLYQ